MPLGSIGYMPTLLCYYGLYCVAVLPFFQFTSRTPCPPSTVKLVFNRQCQAFNLTFILSRQIKLLFDVNRGYYLCMFKFANLNVVFYFSFVGKHKI